MMKRPLFPQRDGVSAPPPDDLPDASRVRAIATRDHHAIRLWASRHQAEPATGEATSSGPSTIQVSDGGAGIRFNFPGMSRFRPISWDEWFDNFERHRLVFVYEEDVADRAYELWCARGHRDGYALEDWIEAERQLTHSNGRPAARYRLVQMDD
jgi:hypothetical protein